MKANAHTCIYTCKHTHIYTHMRPYFLKFLHILTQPQCFSLLQLICPTPYLSFIRNKHSVNWYVWEILTEWEKNKCVMISRCNATFRMLQTFLIAGISISLEVSQSSFLFLPVVLPSYVSVWHPQKRTRSQHLPFISALIHRQEWWAVSMVCYLDKQIGSFTEKTD